MATKSTEPAHGVHLTVTQFAGEASSTRETISKRLADAGMQPSGKRGGFDVYRLKDMYKAVFTAVGGAVDPEKLDPFQRKSHYQAEKERLGLDELRGALVPALEVEQEFAAVFKTMAQWVDTLPDVLERDCGLPRHALAKLEQRLDVLRGELRRQLTARNDTASTV